MDELLNKINASGLVSDADIRAIRQLLDRLGTNATVVDFDEQVQLANVRACMRIWRLNDHVVGFAYVDDFDNLWFDTDEKAHGLTELESEQVEWGIAFHTKRIHEHGIATPLDTTCESNNLRRIRLLERFGFARQPVTTLRYSRSLEEPVQACPLPAGYQIRCVAGEGELEALVALHRAAFGTDQMTVDLRRAMMNTPHYRRDLDLVVVDPQGHLAAFCVCGIEGVEDQTGYSDPIGTLPAYRRLGLAKAVVTDGLVRLRDLGVKVVTLGTSSENLAMQQLADCLKYKRTSEKVWFSREV